MVIVNIILVVALVVMTIIMVNPKWQHLAFYFFFCLLILPFFPEYYVFILFVPFSLMIVISTVLNKHDIFSPWVVFMSIWSFAVGVCSLNITIYEHPWSDYMWFVILCAMLAFMCGSFIGSYSGKKINHFTAKAAVLGGKVARSISSVKFVILLSFLSAISTVIFVYQYCVAGVIPILAGMSGMTVDFARTYVAINSFMQRGALTQIPIFIGACVYLYINRTKGVRNLVVVIILTISALFLVSYASRFFIGTSIVTSLIAYHYIKKNFNIKALIISGLLVVMFIVCIPVYVRGILPDSYLEEIGFQPNMVWAAPLYLGISMNYFVFENLMDYVHKEGFSYGWLTIYPVRALFSQKERLLNVTEGMTPGAEWMVSTTLGEFYGDFGVFGVLFGMMFLGVYCGLVYKRMILHPTTFNIILHSYNVWNIIYSIYVNGFIVFDYAWNILILYLLFRLARGMSGGSGKAKEKAF